MTRIDRLAERFSDAKIDALVVTTPTNIRYLTGFSGSNGTAVVVDGRAHLFTDHRYAERAGDEVAAAGAEVEITIAPGDAKKEILALCAGVGRVGLESDHLSWSRAIAWTGDLGAERTVATSGIVEALREFKDTAEIALMRRAAEIADAALAHLLNDFGGGESERAVARRLDGLVLDGGADGLAFETIVASGPNASRPHHQATERVLRHGDLVIIDFGAEVGGYRSDMTRSFVLGEPSARQNELLDGVRAAQQAGVDCAGPGVHTTAVDDACRSHLSSLGLAEWFTHGTGHGVGIDIHEAPSVSAKGTATLAPGHVVTVEPGVYIPEYGGVRWEDTVVITKNGAEPLTRSAKQPVVL